VSAAPTLITTGTAGSATSSFTGPLILGHELSGRIVAVGEEVPETRIGERVAIEPQKNCRRCRECRAGRYNLCQNMEFYATPPIDGAFAQYCVIRTEFAHKGPDSMSNEAGALLEPLSVAVTTMRKAGVAPGSSILIAGAGTGQDHLRPGRPGLWRCGDHRHRSGARAAGAGVAVRRHPRS
jgi:threonine dehydrogenase-like Zn-dependent dehydrogenase